MVRNILFIYPAEQSFNHVSSNFTIKSLFPKVTAPGILVAFKSVYNRISYKCKWWFFVAICCMWYELFTWFSATVADCGYWVSG